jgi:hypothetical protein
VVAAGSFLGVEAVDPLVERARRGLLLKPL